jgi:hypothetical protein
MKRPGPQFQVGVVTKYWLAKIFFSKIQEQKMMFNTD